MKINRYNALILPTYMALFQIAFIILMGFFARYKFEKDSSKIPGLYTSKKTVLEY